MAAPPQVEVGAQLKQALFDSLTATMSPDQNVRLQGEDQLKVLEVTDGKGFIRQTSRFGEKLVSVSILILAFCFVY